MKHVLALMTAVAAIGTSALAQAANIDFKSAEGQAAGSLGTAQYTYGNVDGSGVAVTVAATGGNISYAAGIGLGVNAPTASDLATQVNAGESLKISFSSEVDIQYVGLTDLDYTLTGTLRNLTWVPDSGGWTVFDDGGAKVTAGQFSTANATAASWGGGTMTLDLSYISDAISSIVLESTNGSQKLGFALGSVGFKTVGGIVSVPELSASGAASAAFLLIGMALLLAGERRRMFAVRAQ